MLDPQKFSNQDEFITALQQLLAKSRLSRREIARRIGQSTQPALEPRQLPSASTVSNWFKGETFPTFLLTPAFAQMLRIIGVATDRIEAWLDALERIRPNPGPRPASSPSPYRGLLPYEPEDAVFFAGRDDAISQLTERVRKAEASGSMTVVVGPSGSGKSSLLRAGLIPALADQSSGHAYAVLTPGEDPLRQLAELFSEIGGANSEQPPLIVIDQFEQLFVSCREAAVQNEFVRTLAAAAGGHDAAAKATVVVALRSDFYTKALGLPLLAQALQTFQVTVGPMTASELRRAVTVPADRAGVTLQPGLVDVVLRDLTPVRGWAPPDAAHEAGTLPLLSHVLYKMWENAHGSSLTVDHYKASGGIEGAVAKTAEDAFSGLSSEARQEIARLVFLRLVHSADDQMLTRRRAAWDELIDAGSADEDEWQDVIDVFVNARLLTADESHVEIAHEALLSAWPRLTRWLDADAEWRHIHQRLRAAAAQWTDSGNSVDILYRGAALHATQEWITSRGYSRSLSRHEREFLRASQSEHEREIAQLRRRTRRRYAVVSVVAVLAIITASAVFIARQKDQTAALTQAQSLSRLIASKADRLRSLDPALAMQLSIVAYQQAHTPEARSSLFNATAVPYGSRLHADAQRNRSVAISSDGTIAAGTDNGTVQLWKPAVDPPQKSSLLKGQESPIIKTAYSPAGTHLAGADKAGHLLAWDLRQPAAPAVNMGQIAKEITSIAWSHDGGHIFASSENKISILAISPPRTVLELAPGKSLIRMIAVSPDGTMLAAASADTNVYLWDLTGAVPAALPTLTEPASQVFSVAFSPDSRGLAAGTGAEHNVYTWDLTDTSQPRLSGPPLEGPQSWVNALSFSPDTATIAAASSDNRTWTFDLQTRQKRRTYPHPSPVIAASFDGTSRLVTLATDGVVRSWPLPGPLLDGPKDSVFGLSFDHTGTKLGVVAGASDNTVRIYDTRNSHSPRLYSSPIRNEPRLAKLSGAAVMTPDGKRLAVGTVDGHVAVWDIHNPAAPSLTGPPVPAAEDQIEALSVSDDGQLFAASVDDGTVRLIDTATTNIVSTLHMPDEELVYQAAFSHDRRLLAAGSIDNNVYLWDVTTPASPTLLTTLKEHTTSVLSIAFSPDSALLAAGAADGTVRLWNVTDPSKPTQAGPPLTGPVGYIYSMAFRANSRSLAAGSTDSTVWLWNLTNPAQPEYLATLTGHEQGVLAVAFNAATETVAAGGHDRTVRLWTTDVTTAAKWICPTAGEPISLPEWKQYVPELPYAPPCTDGAVSSHVQLTQRR